MSGSKEKSFRRLTNSHTWVSVVALVITFIIIVTAINALIAFFVLHTIDSKVDGEYNSIKKSAYIYEESLDQDDEKYTEILSKEEPDYFISDKNGNIIEEHGENTCSNIGGHLGFIFGDRSYYVYEDENDKSLYYDDRGLFVLDINKVHWNEEDISVDENSIKEVSESEDIMDKNIVSSGYIDMPVWIGIELSNGNNFVAKGHVRSRVSDYIITIVGMIVLNLVMIIFLIIRLIKILTGIIRNKKLNKLFLIDEVTNGYNWMAFLLKGNQILGKRKNSDKRYAIIHLAIVKYRNYCMCHSIEEGNRILRRVSDIIMANLTPIHEISAHVSSSSFAILMEVSDGKAVEDRIEKLIKELEKVDTRGRETQMAGHTDVFHAFNFQAGIYMVEPNIIDGKKQKRENIETERYYNNAVTARMKLAMTGDSGISFFDDKLMEDEKWTMTVEEYQSRAVENEEFAVYYQPKYSPDNGELVGAEALIRWISPEFGFVPPNRFIPIFENNGFITTIDHYMICHVARDQKNWLDAGIRCVPVSVNVSRAHFAESDLAEQIKNMVDEIGTPHELLEIELTESAFFDDKDALIETIRRLKSYGFSVSMDDFGSGYSSLNSLKDMDLDVLKLDAEFFRGDADTGRKEVVISEAIKIAKKLSMRTVAEGVEEKEEVEFLREQGCDMIQGYYFAKPMPKNEYEERMNEVYHMPDG